MTTAAFRDHPIRALLQQMLALQQRSDFADPTVADNEQYAFARDKTFSITKHVDTLISRTPALLASFSALNTLQAQLQAPLNELNAFVTNKTPTHLINAAAQLEQNVLPLLWGLPAYVPDAELETLSAVVQRLEDSSAETIRQLVASREELSASLNEAISETQSLRQKISQLMDSAVRERAEAAAEVANLQRMFAEKEIERAGSFAAELTAYKEAFAAAQIEAAASATKTLNDLDSQREIAAKIVGVVGNIGVTGNFQCIADKEGKQANIWRWITIGIFMVGITVAAATFAKFWNQPFNTENLWSVIVRLLYAIAITAPAWYTARESARHRTNADRARQTELELASLGPFIELMPEEKKIEIKETLTKAYFGRQIDAHSAQTPLDVMKFKDLADLVKLLKS